VLYAGDSITVIGYPKYLQKLLGDNYRVNNFGVSGATMLKNGDKPYWSFDNFKAAVASNPNIVVIMLGTNDAKSFNWVHGANYSGDYTTMIDIFAALPSKPSIFICTPAPIYNVHKSSHDFNIRQQNVNEVIVPEVRAIAAANNKVVGLIDVFEATGGLGLKYPSWFMDDGVHPNEDGTSSIATAVHNSIKAAQNTVI